MTEEDAKTKPCIAPCYVNVGRAWQMGNSKTIYRCIGPACLAWRWDIEGDTKPFRVSPEEANNPKAYPGWPRLTTLPDERGWVEISPPIPTEGFCGWVRKP